MQRRVIGRGYTRINELESSRDGGDIDALCVFGGYGNVAIFTKYLTIRPKCEYWQNGRIARRFVSI